MADNTIAFKGDAKTVLALLAEVEQAYAAEAEAAEQAEHAAEARQDAVRALAAGFGWQEGDDAVRFQHPASGATLTIVVNGGKGGESAFVRGLRPAKSTGKAKPRAVLSIG